MLLAFSFTGCDQLSRSPLEDERDPHYVDGQKRMNAMDWDGAIESFERALQSNPNNAAAHLSLGTLYNDRKNDYAAAIYHLERHLKLRPNSPMAEVVNGHITACKRELAKTVSYAIISREAQQELDRYIRTNEILSRRIDFLEAELKRRPLYVTNYVTNFVAMPNFSPNDRSAARMTRPTEPVTQPEQAQRPLEQAVQSETPRQVIERPTPIRPQQNTQRTRQETARPVQAQPAGRSHTVRPGETLAVIARKYGVSVASLKQANPDAARGARAGQRLVIPSR